MTTNSIKKTGGDYDDIAGWEVDSDVSGSPLQRWIGEIADNEEYLDEAVLINGSTGTDGIHNFVWLRAHADNKHSGVSGTGHARIRETATGVNVVDLSDRYSIITDLEVVLDTTSAPDSEFGIICTDEDHIICRCIVRATSKQLEQAGIREATTDTPDIAYIDHCVIYGFDRAGISFTSASTGQALYVDYCTIDDCGDTDDGSSGGIATRANPNEIYNCIAVRSDGTTAEDYRQRDGTPNWTGTDNLSGDDSATDKFPASPATSFDNCALVDTSPGSGNNVWINSISGRDYGIGGENSFTKTQEGSDRTGSEPAPQTVDGSALVQDFSIDIAGVTRAAFTIGAFEVVAGGPSFDAVVVGRLAPRFFSAAAKTAAQVVASSMALAAANDSGKTSSGTATAKLAIKPTANTSKTSTGLTNTSLALRSFLTATTSAVFNAVVRMSVALRGSADAAKTTTAQVKASVAVRGSTAADKTVAGTTRASMATRASSTADKSAAGTVRASLALRTLLATTVTGVINGVVRMSLPLRAVVATSSVKLSAIRARLALRPSNGTTTTRSGSVLGRISIRPSNDGGKTSTGVAFNRLALRPVAALIPGALGTTVRKVPLDGVFSVTCAMDGVFDPDVSQDGTFAPVLPLGGEADPV